ncbi:MAG TPA: pyridoxamine 5'-phosphate oxidase family protein [Dehalococcoidia bacterium]|nr:pyridoxamine 5'-phosphate oxidase family protein [Dehalococcoidia bacterium]
MSWLPEPVRALLEKALVCEFTVVGDNGRPVTHPLLPLWDGERVYMTSSVLFSKKLEHIKRDPRVSLAITDRVATGGQQARCVVQGDARVIEDDIHTTWEQVLPLWRAKEPGIDFILGKRFALPLFFERAIIEVRPRKVTWWEDGDPAKEPQVVAEAEVAA